MGFVLAAAISKHRITALLGGGLAKRTVLIGAFPAAQNHAVTVQRHVTDLIVNVGLFWGMFTNRDQAAPRIVLAGRRAGLEAAVRAVAVVGFLQIAFPRFIGNRIRMRVVLGVVGITGVALIVFFVEPSIARRSAQPIIALGAQAAKKFALFRPLNLILNSLHLECLAIPAE